MCENASGSLPFESPNEENGRLRLRRALTVHCIPIPPVSPWNPSPAKTGEALSVENKEDRARKHIALFRGLFRGRAMSGNGAKAERSSARADGPRRTVDPWRVERSPFSAGSCFAASSSCFAFPLLVLRFFLSKASRISNTFPSANVFRRAISANASWNLWQKWHCGQRRIYNLHGRQDG